ncbi:hypothetical protein PRZ48_006552 [Zasmidium cellare]|uniref:BTB domain-containing protein n=1 Tax=Zasmidium cellare TaxID=395010 RepID=A0ABR0EPF3_ZASCE|nr:hypothetical protein PRZ48_006552 [Zasmidium cellare]
MSSVEQRKKTTDADGPSRRSLLKGIDSLYKSQEYSDLTIKCGSREWQVHKAVVCTQSTFFAKACKPKWQESFHAVVELHDEHEDVVEQLIDYLYTSTYDDNFCTTSDATHGPMQFAVKVYTAADKYDIPELGGLIQKRFLERVKDVVSVQDFFCTVRELYFEAPSSAKEMRDAFVASAVHGSHTLFDTEVDNFTTSEEFQRIMNEVPAFGTEVISALSARVQGEIANLSRLRLAKLSLYRDPKYSDLIIKSGTQDFWEFKNGVIELHDDRTEVIAQVIQFLYLSTFEDIPSFWPDRVFGPIQFNLKVFMAADKYDIPHLADQARAKFKTRISRCGNAQDFISTVRELYEDELDITKEMRKSAIEAAVSHASRLFEQDSKANEKDDQTDTFHKLIYDIPTFGAEVMAGFLAKVGQLEQSLQGGLKYRCRLCNIGIEITGTWGIKPSDPDVLKIKRVVVSVE